jgi:hypothetical protein
MLAWLVLFGIAVNSYSFTHFLGSIGFVAAMLFILWLFHMTLERARNQPPEQPIGTAIPQLPEQSKDADSPELPPHNTGVGP